MMIARDESAHAPLETFEPSPVDVRAMRDALDAVRDGGPEHALTVARTIAAITNDNELALEVSNALVRLAEKRARDLERDVTALEWGFAPSESSDRSEPRPDAGDLEDWRVVLRDAHALLEAWARGVSLRAELAALIRWAMTETKTHIAMVSATD